MSSDGSLQLAATPSAPAAAAAAAAVAAAAAGAAAAAAAAGGGSVWGAALGEAGKKPLPKRHRPFRYIQLPVKKARPLFGDGPFPITLTARMIVDGKAMQVPREWVLFVKGFCWVLHACLAMPCQFDPFIYAPSP